MAIPVDNNSSKIPNAILKCSSLKSETLNISHTLLKTNYLPYIEEMLSKNAVQNLLMNSCSLDETVFIPILDLLKKYGSNLCVIEFFDNQINSSCIIPLAQTLPHLPLLERVKIGDNPLTSDNLAHFFSSLVIYCPFIKQIHIGGISLEQDGAKKICPYLLQLSHLSSLGLRGCSLGPRGIAELYPVLCKPSTDYIYLRQNNLGDEGIAVLAMVLSNNPALRILEVQSNNIGPKGVQTIMDVLMNLRSSSWLHAVNFTNNLIGDEGVKYIAGVIRMQSTLYWPGEVTIRPGVKLSVRGIQSLILSGCGISSEAAADLASLIESPNSPVTNLDLSSNEIGTSGVTTLMPSLRKAPLTSLNLTENKITSGGALPIALALAANPVLKQLNLSVNMLRNTGALQLARSLLTNTNLSRLLLTDNAFTDDAGKYFLDSLKQCHQKSSLAHLAIGGQRAGVANRIRESIRDPIDQYLRLIGQRRRNSVPVITEYPIMPLTPAPEHRRYSSLDIPTHHHRRSSSIMGFEPSFCDIPSGTPQLDFDCPMPSPTNLDRYL